MALLGWSHVGVCCSDLEASTAFYESVFGFRQLFTVELGPEVAATMELDGRFFSRMLVRPDMRLELLQWIDPVGTGDKQRRGMLGFGLTHLAFRVDTVEELHELVEKAGGQVHHGTLSRMDPGVGLMYVTDPDGTRIELMQGTPDFSGS